jgi:hypothetical protein
VPWIDRQISSVAVRHGCRRSVDRAGEEKERAGRVEAEEARPMDAEAFGDGQCEGTDQHRQASATAQATAFRGPGARR